MRCEEIGALLDRYLDGELSEAQWSEVLAHGRECPACAEQIAAAEQMKALFSEMTPEVDVPLAAQAAWRSAVKAEAGRRRGRRFYSWASIAAAAIVLAVGVNFALNAKNAPKLRSSTAAPAAVESAEIAVEEMDEAVPTAPTAMPEPGAQDAAEAKPAEAASEPMRAESAAEPKSAGITTETNGAVDETMFKSARMESAAVPAEPADAAPAAGDADFGEAVQEMEEAIYDMAETAYLEADGAGDAELSAASDAAFEDSAEDAEEADMASDGAAAMPSRSMAAASVESAAPVHEIALKVASIDKASGIIADLVSEYEGQADVQRVENGANIYVSMPAGNVAEFIRALAHLDASGAELSAPQTGEESVSMLLLTLTE